MRSGMVMEITAEYSKVFNDSPTLDELPEGVSRKTLLKISSFFLGFANRDSELHYAKEFIKMVFRGENNKFANDVFLKIKENEDRVALETGSRRPTIVANHITSLSLFEYAYNNLDDTETLSEAEIKVNVFKAYLLLNEINTTKTHDAWDSVEGLELKDPLSARIMAMSYGYSDLINYGKRELIVTQIIKSIHFFEFLESDARTIPVVNVGTKSNDW